MRCVKCPSCGSSALDLLVSREDVTEEILLRRDFFATRMEGPPDPGQEKDRSDVAHAAAAEILICRACDILVRNEDESPDFEEDAYAPFAMERMLRAHIEAYRRKEALYRPQLPEGAKIVEVGSYVGGFLHVAHEWGWEATGVDVGHDTAAFARARGYATRNEPLEECGFDDASFDGVFIWNCFEQLDDSKRVLGEARRILKPHGILVIRTPNAGFYVACEQRRSERDILIALGHGNLLGFPHLYGFNPASLHRLAAQFELTETRQAGDRHIMPSLRPLTATAMKEAERVEQLVPLPSWFESTFSRA